MRDPVLSVVFFILSVDRQPLQQPVDGCGGAPKQSRAVGGVMCKSRKTVVRTFLRV